MICPTRLPTAHCGCCLDTHAHTLNNPPSARPQTTSSRTHPDHYPSQILFQTMQFSTVTLALAFGSASAFMGQPLNTRSARSAAVKMTTQEELAELAESNRDALGAGLGEKDPLCPDPSSATHFVLVLTVWARLPDTPDAPISATTLSRRPTHLSLPCPGSTSTSSAL